MICHVLHMIQEVNKSSETMPLTVTYTPISVGKLRMWTNMLESIKMLHGLGKYLVIKCRAELYETKTK